MCEVAGLTLAHFTFKHLIGLSCNCVIRQHFKVQACNLSCDGVVVSAPDCGV